MPTITSEDRLGSVLEGKYRLDRVLGEGGMGVVFAGEHIRLKRPVAVKFLHGHVATNADARRRFIREAESAASLKHPNVVDVMDVGESPDGSAFMVLEFLKGDSLNDRLDHIGRMSEEETLRVMVPVCQAVGYAHANGIVHRDLKPDNIFLAQGPNNLVIPKVLDFGIAKLLDGGGPSATQTGSIMGTPLYMSPEQANGLKTLGPPADIWSLGVILYQCVTGRLPWDFPPEPTLPMILVTIATRPAAPILSADPGITPELAALIDRCIIPDPSVRFPDSNALAHALDALRGRVRAGVASADFMADTALGIQASSIPGLAPPAAFAAGTLGQPGSGAPATPAYDAPSSVTPSGSHAPGTNPPRTSAASGLPTSTVSTPIRSMTRALWAIAAVAALGLVAGTVAFFSRPDPAAQPPPQVVISAPPPTVVAAPVAAPPAPAPVAPPPPPTLEPPSTTTERRRPATAVAAAVEMRVEAASEPPPRMTESSTMRRCANGVCSDLGGL